MSFSARAGYCITGLMEQGRETTQMFQGSCHGRCSPLYWRVPILLWSTIVTIYSVASFWGTTDKFLLYMTHWGLLLIIIESVLGVIVTMKKCDQIPDATFGLPWYVKTYWVLYNITIPVAFLITVFYWGVIKTTTPKINFAPNPVLDVMLHAVNSVVMLVELVSSAHPSRLLHIMQPLYFALAYLIFSVSYYYAGGLDPWGNHFIYPMIDWSKPEQAMVVITISAVFLALMHLLVVALAAIRDAIARRCLRGISGEYNDGFKA